VRESRKWKKRTRKGEMVVMESEGEGERTGWKINWFT